MTVVTDVLVDMAEEECLESYRMVSPSARIRPTGSGNRPLGCSITLPDKEGLADSSLRSE
jgi:hypothetical protein